MRCEQFEVSLSGYLDGELTQQESQKVALHIEECPNCRKTFEALSKAQLATRQLQIEHPTKKEWDVMENRILETLTRGIGWSILIVWSVVTIAYGTYQFATAPGEPLFEKILVFGFFLGFALLFLSVLCQRLREAKSDRYKGVLR